MLTFEWDGAKNARNIRKHAIDFVDVIELFNHPMLTVRDDRGLYDEDRWVSIGWITSMLSVVVYTEHDDDMIRVISARKATLNEMHRYEEIIKN